MEQKIKKFRAETLVYIKQYLYFLKSEGWLKVLLFPFITIFINILVGGDKVFSAAGATRVTCFIIVCEAIWCGLFHSILVVVKERKHVKRDSISGASLWSYLVSRALVEFLICAIQSAFFTLGFYIVSLTSHNPLPDSSVVFPVLLLDVYVTVLFATYAADGLGILISCVAKSEIQASQIAPYILIAELALSGVLFSLNNFDFASKLMIGRWGTEALVSICDTDTLADRKTEELHSAVDENVDNEMTTVSADMAASIDEEFEEFEGLIPDRKLKSMKSGMKEKMNANISKAGENMKQSMYDQMDDMASENDIEFNADRNAGHIEKCWGILFIFALAEIVLGGILLGNIKKEKI